MGRGPFNRYGMAVAAVTSAVAGAGIYYYGQTDVTPPAVTVTAPSAGATVSGTSVTVSATATDNVGVVGVQFKLDGVNLGTEDTTAPYSISWDSTTAANRAHTVSAFARDAAGNNATATNITVTVSNLTGGGGNANVFVSASGSDTGANCKRFASATTNPDTSGISDCHSFPKAYSVAACGDTVAVEPGSYAGQDITSQNVTVANMKSCGGGCHDLPAVDHSGCVTFQPDGGGTALSSSVQICGGANSRGNLGILVGVPYMQIRNMTLCGPLNVAWLSQTGGTACPAGVPQTRDVIADGIELNAATASFNISQASAVSFTNSRLDGAADRAGVSNISSPNTVLATGNGNCNTTSWPSLTVQQLIPDHILIDHDYWNGLIQTTNVGSPHEQCMHVLEANDLVWTNTTMVNCAQYDINIEGQGLAAGIRNLDGITIENNVFDTPCSNQVATTAGGTCGVISGFALICHSAGDTITNTTIAYNSFTGNQSQFMHLASGGNGCLAAANSSTFAGDLIVGNAFNLGSPTCRIAQGAAYRYNSSTASSCDATDENVASPFTNPAPTAWDFAPAASGLFNFVPVSVTVGAVTISCPASDIAGNLRPKSGNTLCTAGAYER